MSSLTDIIFLLLIFFMLTSSLVQINPVNLPVSDSKTVASQSVVVTIKQDGTFLVGSQEVAAANVSRAIRQAIAASNADRKEMTVTIAAEKDAPFDYVLDVMKVANNLGMKAILATQPRT